MVRKKKYAKDSKEYDAMLFEYIEKELGLNKNKIAAKEKKAKV